MEQGGAVDTTVVADDTHLFSILRSLVSLYILSSPALSASVDSCSWLLCLFPPLLGPWLALTLSRHPAARGQQLCWCATADLTSSWTSLRLSFPLECSYRGIGKIPRPAHPWVTASTRTVWCNHDSVCSTASLALHFLQVLTLTPALATLRLLESLYITTSLARVTLNSSDFRGNLVLWPESAMLLRLLGSPCHLLRKLLTFIFMSSTIEMWTF